MCNNVYYSYYCIVCIWSCLYLWALCACVTHSDGLLTQRACLLQCNEYEGSHRGICIQVCYSSLWTDRRADRQTDRRADRQTGRQTGKLFSRHYSVGKTLTDRNTNWISKWHTNCVILHQDPLFRVWLNSLSSGKRWDILLKENIFLHKIYIVQTYIY